MSHDRILTNNQEADNKFLRKKTKEFDFSSSDKSQIRQLINRMRRTMKEANGVGLSANQIGLPYRVFVAEVAGPNNNLKFYAVFNPHIEKYSEEHDFLEEGCLSVPGIYGKVRRSLEVSLRGKDKNGKVIRIKAWGLLAHVFQHEVDHLDGKLFIDTAKDLQHFSPDIKSKN